jgi:outer membrane receptor protein involved in Fe transport
LVFVGFLGTASELRAEEQSPSSAEPADLGGAVIEGDPNDDASYLDPALLGPDVIVVWGARPERPFDRDTKLRLTGTELRKRGINNVAEALDMLPEVTVRAAGRGGRQIDIRGARKGSIKILLDGIAVSDPFYGNLDLSAIPVTDIAEIRVSASPASPIDGPGGPGGVIEILTRDAIGPGNVRARVTGSSEPSLEASATGRTMLTEHLAARVSASVVTGRQDFVVLPGETMNPTTVIDEDRVQSVGAARIEYRKGDRRLVTDLWTQQGAFAVAPKNVTGTSNSYTVIDGETQGRLGVAYDDKVDDLKIQARAHIHLLTRDTSYYSDAALTMQTNVEKLNGSRSGLAFLANRELGERWQMIGSANLESDSGDVESGSGRETKGRTTIAQTAVAAQYEQDNFDMQHSVGVAVPLGLGAKPFPEFKAAVRYEPASIVELKAISGFKGRLPTLREQHNIGNGNTELGPEKVLFGEVGLKLTPASFLQGSANAYVRRTNGQISNTFIDGDFEYINTGELTIRGVDTMVEGKLHKWVSGGASWSYTEAEDPDGSSKPLDFLPKHRMSSWIRAAVDNGGATLRVQYSGTQVDKNVELPRRVLVQLSGYYRFFDSYQFTVRGENIAGHDYLQRNLVPGPGRTVYASLQSDWE